MFADSGDMFSTDSNRADKLAEGPMGMSVLFTAVRQSVIGSLCILQWNEHKA